MSRLISPSPWLPGSPRRAHRKALRELPPKAPPGGNCAAKYCRGAQNLALLAGLVGAEDAGINSGATGAALPSLANNSDFSTDSVSNTQPNEVRNQAKARPIASGSSDFNLPSTRVRSPEFAERIIDTRREPCAPPRSHGQERQHRDHRRHRAGRAPVDPLRMACRSGLSHRGDFLCWLSLAPYRDQHRQQHAAVEFSALAPTGDQARSGVPPADRPDHCGHRRDDAGSS